MKFGKKLPSNSENKPRGLYFSKALFKRLIFGGAYIERGLSKEGNLRFKIDWASLIVGRKFTVFALFYFAFEGNFQVQASRGAYIWRGNLMEVFCITGLGSLYMEGLIFGILRYFKQIITVTLVTQGLPYSFPFHPVAHVHQ